MLYSTELKAVRVAAQAFRENPAFNAEDAIMELGDRRALTSFLGEDGIPAMVQRTKIICPQSLMGAPEAMTRAKAILRDGMEKYDEAEDNVSAYEVLADETQAAEALSRRSRSGWKRKSARRRSRRRRASETRTKRAAVALGMRSAAAPRRRRTARGKAKPNAPLQDQAAPPAGVPQARCCSGMQ